MSRVVLGALPSERPDEMEKPDFLSLHPGAAFIPREASARHSGVTSSSYLLRLPGRPGHVLFTKGYFCCFPVMSKASIYISVMWV